MSCTYRIATGMSRQTDRKQKNHILAARLGQHEHLVQMLRHNSNELVATTMADLRGGQDVGAIVESLVELQSGAQSASDETPPPYAS